MHQNENIEKAIEALQEARVKVSGLLSVNPALQVRSNNALDSLIGGLSHTIQGNLPRAVPANDMGPITHVFGQKVEREVKPTTPAKVAVKSADVDELRTRITDAYPTFRDRDNKSLIESLTDMEMRGIAKMAGLEVTETEPKKISGAFVDKIKAAMTKKEEQEAAEAEAEKAVATKLNGEQDV
jgi:hypothetical protein